MSVIDKLIRLLKDDYKVGAEMQSKKPIVYIDPKKIDLWQIEIDSANNNTAGIARQMAEQLDAQYPGLSQKFEQKELVQLLKNSLKLGPHAYGPKGDIQLCLINEPNHNEISADNLFTLFGLSKQFNPNHLITPIGTDAEWAQLSGEHEGEHCNQDPIYNKNRSKRVQTLEGEILSDRAAIKTLRAAGKYEIIEVLKAMRVLGAPNGGETHATSIFLDDEEYAGATEEHLDAADRFCNEMRMGVAVNLGISLTNAEKLRTSNPRVFAAATDDALKKGQIPALRDMSETDIMSLIAKKMGCQINEKEGVIIGDAKTAYDMYKKLKTDGVLLDKGIPNPFINKYIQSYLNATNILFIKDTTPIIQPAAPASPAPESSTDAPPDQTGPTDAELAAQKEKDLINDAENQSYTLADEAVRKALGLTQEELDELRITDEAKYYKTVEEELAKGNIPLKTSFEIPLEQIDELKAKRLGVPTNELYNQPYFIVKMVDEELKKQGAFLKIQDNPYVKGIIEKRIKQYHQDKQEELSQESQKVSSAANADKYNHLLLARPDDGKGIPQIDLRNDDRGHMKIGDMTTPEYFAMKADPVLSQAPDLSTKSPTLTKTAQNSPVFKATTDSLQA